MSRERLLARTFVELGAHVDGSVCRVAAALPSASLVVTEVLKVDATPVTHV